MFGRELFTDCSLLGEQRSFDRNLGVDEVRLGKLKTDQLVFEVLDDAQIRRLLAWKART